MIARRICRILTASMLLVTCAVGGAGANVVVSPARIELEVAPEGSHAHLTLFNRGADPVAFSLFAGMGSHGIDGSPLYFDHPEARVEGARLLTLDQSKVYLDPGDSKIVRIDFAPATGLVAVYPVIFLELQSADEAMQPVAPAVRSVARLAVPVLLTYQATRAERRVGFQIEEVRANPEPSTGGYVVDVTVRNTGNVHDWVRGRVDLVGSDGVIRGELLLPEQRVLPGAARTLKARMTLADTDRIVGIHAATGSRDVRYSDPLHLVATVYGDGWSSAPALHTMSTTEVAMATVSGVGGEETLR